MYYVVLLAILLIMPTTSEACQLFRDVAFDTSGNVIAGASVSVTYTGTSTTATLYTSAACTTTQSNPMTSGSDGIFSFWIADGVFDITVTASNFTIQPATGLQIFEAFGENTKSVGFFPTSNPSAPDLCETGTGAIDQIGATPTTLIINKAMTCASDKTIPSTLAVQFIYPGKVTISSGKTLTISGPVIGPPVRLFYGSGTATLSTTTSPLQFNIWTGGTGVGIKIPTTTFANLGTATAGSLVICTDCTAGSPCAGSGSGTLAFAFTTTWVCPTFP